MELSAETMLRLLNSHYETITITSAADNYRNNEVTITGVITEDTWVIGKGKNIEFAAYNLLVKTLKAKKDG